MQVGAVPSRAPFGAFRKIQLAAMTFGPTFPSLASEPPHGLGAILSSRPAAQPERTMPHLISPGASIAVGFLHPLGRVQSPAAPLIALARLLGIVADEQAVPRAAQFHDADTADTTAEATTCSPRK